MEASKGISREKLSVIRSSLELAKRIDAGAPIFIEYFGSWCGGCKAMEPIYQQASELVPGACIVRADIEYTNDLASDAGVSRLPALVFYRRGEDQKMLAGRKPLSEVLDFIRSALTPDEAGQKASQQWQRTFSERSSLDISWGSVEGLTEPHWEWIAIDGAITGTPDTTPPYPRDDSESGTLPLGAIPSGFQSGDARSPASEAGSGPGGSWAPAAWPGRRSGIFGWVWS